MKSELNVLEVRHMVQELQCVVGARLNKVYASEAVLFQFHKSGEGKFFVEVAGPLIYIVQEKGEMPKAISGVCAKLRKHLEGKKLAALEQVGAERIVKLTFETQKETYYVFVELFAKGNVVLTDAARRILAATDEREFKDRKVMRGEVYELPPSKEDVFNLKEVPSSEKELAKVMGKTLAQEVLARGGGMKGYKSLLSEPFAPVQYEDGMVSSFSLVQSKKKGTKVTSFSELLVSEQPVKKKASPLEKKKVKVQEVIDAQLATLESCEAKIEELQRTGEFMYEHFQELQELLALVKAKKSANVKVGKFKATKFDPKTGEVTVEFAD